MLESGAPGMANADTSRCRLCGLARVTSSFAAGVQHDQPLGHAALNGRQLPALLPHLLVQPDVLEVHARQHREQVQQFLVVVVEPAPVLLLHEVESARRAAQDHDRYAQKALNRRLSWREAVGAEQAPLVAYGHPTRSLGL